MAELNLEKTLAKLVKDAGKSAHEKSLDERLALLDEIGAAAVGDDSLVFQGTKFVLPSAMEEHVDDAIEYLQDWDEQQNSEFGFNKVFPYKPYDGAAAFERAMKRIFGTTGVSKAGFFGPSAGYATVPSGPGGQTIQVVWGRVEFSPLKATFHLGATRSKNGIVFELNVTAPRKMRRKIEAFFKVVEDELREHSLYKGRAITDAGSDEPEFVDTAALNPDQLIYTQEVLTQIEANLWTPIRYTEAIRATGTPLKRAVLLEGPNGTGKSMAGLRTAQIAQENGWTFILVRQGEDPLAALQTASMYAPAVVWVEDLDIIASAEGHSRAQLSKVLDVLDSVQTKGAEVMAGFTTNFAEKLDKGVLRAGRVDAVIHVAELDREGYEKLVRTHVPAGMLDSNVDYDKVAEAYSSFLPAFAVEATQSAIRYNLARNAGQPGVLTTQDLVDAAYGMKDHLRLMAEAEHGTGEPSLDDRLETILTRVLTQRVKGSLVDRDGDPIYPLEIKEAE